MNSLRTGLTTFGGNDEPFGGRIVVIGDRFREIRSKNKIVRLMPRSCSAFDPLLTLLRIQ